MTRPEPSRAAVVWVAVGIGLWNLGNFAFFVLAGRILGPADYGVVAALLAVVVATFVPLSALQALAARRFSVEARAAPGLVRRTIWRSIQVGVLLVAGTAVIAFLVLDVSDAEAWRLVLTALSLMWVAPMYLAIGVLQGRSRFRAVALALCLWGLARPALLVGVAVVDPSDAIAWVLAANAAGMATAFLVALVMAARDLFGDAGLAQDEWRSFRAGLPGPLLGLVGVAVVLNADVIVAAVHLDAVTAGRFAAVAVLAKAGVLLTPQVLGTAWLPRIAQLAGAGRSAWRFAGLMAGATVVVGAVGALVALPIERPLLGIFGSDFADGAWMLAPMIAALIPLGVVFALVSFDIARTDDRFPVAMIGVAAVTVVALATLGGSVAAILAIDAIGCCLGVLVHAWLHRGDGGSLVGLALARLRVG